MSSWSTRVPCVLRFPTRKMYGAPEGPHDSQFHTEPRIPVRFLSELRKLQDPAPGGEELKFVVYVVAATACARHQSG